MPRIRDRPSPSGQLSGTTRTPSRSRINIECCFNLWPRPSRQAHLRRTADTCAYISRIASCCSRLTRPPCSNLRLDWTGGKDVQAHAPKWGCGWKAFGTDSENRRIDWPSRPAVAKTPPHAYGLPIQQRRGQGTRI